MQALTCLHACRRQAMVLFQAAAQQGDPGGLVGQAYLHMHGLGTPVNVTAARLAYEAGASTGNADACYNLGMWLGGAGAGQICRLPGERPTAHDI
jgi:TPR repeat protein